MQRVAPPIQGRLSERETVAVLFGVLFLATVDNSLLISLLPRIELELGVAIQRLGWIFSAYALAAALSNLVVGPLTDRWGRIGFLRLAVMAFVALGIATYLSRGFEQLLILRTLNGAAGGAVSTCAVSLVGDAFPYRRRGRIMGMVLSAYFVALIVGVPGGVTVAEYWGWRSVFLANGGLALVLSIWLLRRFSLDRRPQPLPPRGSVYRLSEVAQGSADLGGTGRVLCDFRSHFVSADFCIGSGDHSSANLVAVSDNRAGSIGGEPFGRALERSFGQADGVSGGQHADGVSAFVFDQGAVGMGTGNALFRDQPLGSIAANSLANVADRVDSRQSARSVSGFA